LLLERRNRKFRALEVHRRCPLVLRVREAGCKVEGGVLASGLLGYAAGGGHYDAICVALGGLR